MRGQEHVVAEELSAEALKLYVESGLRLLGWYLRRHAEFSRWCAENDREES